jgi:hypothetical protein
MVSVTKTSKQRVPRSGQNEGVTTYIPPEVKRELEVWASEEERSVSWLVGKLLEEAVKQRKKVKKRGETLSLIHI